MVNYNLVIPKSTQKEIKQLQVDAIKRILERLDKLCEDPYPVDCKKLKTDLGFRIRVGDYRVIYTVDKTNRIINIAKIGHRKEVYRK